MSKTAVLFIATVFLLLGGARFAEAVEFADPNLEAAIRAKIDNKDDPIAVEDLLSIVELELISGAIADLSGIEALENLEVLVLVGHRLVDIAPLASLKKLRALDLANNQIVDITPLSSLSALIFLGLASNSVSDLSPSVFAGPVAGVAVRRKSRRGY